jgi:hypothetical protein
MLQTNQWQVDCVKCGAADEAYDMLQKNNSQNE